MLGVPGATDMRYPFQIAQHRGAVAIRYEFAHALRIIHRWFKSGEIQEGDAVSSHRRK